MSKTHDYTKGRWGHDVTYSSLPGDKLRAIGWGLGIAVGDFLILKHPEGGTTRYRVESISYAWNPGDMWTATLVFAPRGRT